MSRDYTKWRTEKVTAVVAMLVTSIASPFLSMIGYLVSRIFTGRRDGLSWSEILSDGAKPITGSIWIDAILFLFILLIIGASFAWVLLRG